MKEQVRREHQRWVLAQQQLEALRQQQRQALEQEELSANLKEVQSLTAFRGIGPVSAWLLVHEYFGWRRFRNVKEVGAASGLTPTPYASGGMNREQGLSKAGNRRVRSLMIQWAWRWLRYQPESALARWYRDRFASGSSRLRRTGIVALARKLLVALWKYQQSGTRPQGAVLQLDQEAAAMAA